MDSSVKPERDVLSTRHIYLISYPTLSLPDVFRSPLLQPDAIAVF